LLRFSLALLIVWHGAEVTGTLIVALEVVWAYGPKGYSWEGDDIVTFENVYFGYLGDGLTATEWYPQAGAIPAW
jgi:hypothetical protein